MSARVGAEDIGLESKRTATRSLAYDPSMAEDGGDRSSRPRALPYAAFGVLALLLGIGFQITSLRLAHAGSAVRMLRPSERVGAGTSPGFDGWSFFLLAEDPLVSA